MLLSALVGVVAGLGAVAFQVLCQAVQHSAMDWLAGYSAGGPAGEARILPRHSPLTGGLSPGLLLLVITAGGLVCGLIVYTLAPETEGHGTDAAIHAYHHGRGLIRPRVPVVKMLSAAVTIGTGGSGGREGPIAQIGAGFGSFLGTRLGLGPRQRRILLAAGLGAGVSAIFRAPLAGAMFAVEVLYREPDFEYEPLIPAFIASVVAYVTFGLVVQEGLGAGDGFAPIFAVLPGLRFDDPRILVPLTALAGAMVAASWLYVRLFYGTHALFARLRLPKHLRPAVGALATGAFALLVFAAMSRVSEHAARGSLCVLSFGYGILQDLFRDGPGLLVGGAWGDVRVAAALLVVVGLGKIVTTSLTISSGGSGGVFGPSMVIGGTLGGAVGLAFSRWMPDIVVRPDMFVILGMAGFFTAAAKTPLSTLIMVSELTGSYELLLPSMWVCAISYLLSPRWTIYRAQVPTRLDSPAHRGDYIMDVLSGLTVRDALRGPGGPVTTVPADLPLPQVVHLLPASTQSVFPVLDRDGRYAGLFGLAAVRQALYRAASPDSPGTPAPPAEAIISQGLAQPVEPLRPDMPLAEAVDRFARTPHDELPVVSASDGQVLALLGRQDVLALYNSRLMEMKAQADRES